MTFESLTMTFEGLTMTATGSALWFESLTMTFESLTMTLLRCAGCHTELVEVRVHEVTTGVQIF